jgi:hypothetical protein
MCLSRKPTKTKRRKVRDVAERIGAIPIHQKPLARIRLADQPTLHDFFELPGGDESPTSEHIEATGDPLIPKAAGLIRIALQNPNGIRLKDNVDVLPEVAAIEQLHIDAAAFPESKLYPPVDAPGT